MCLWTPFGLSKLRDYNGMAMHSVEHYVLLEEKHDELRDIKYKVFNPRL